MDEDVVGPIFDRVGKVLYHAMYRKPKWVVPKELERYNAHAAEEEPTTFQQRDKGRILMENPFTRRPGDQRVFSHIRDFEIAKFVLGQSYLAYTNLDYSTCTGIHSHLNSFQLFLNEIWWTAYPEKVKLSERLQRQLFREQLAEFKMQPFARMGLPHPYSDLKAGFHKSCDALEADPLHRDFMKAYRRRERGERIRFVFTELFGEDAKEWKLLHDPVRTFARQRRYAAKVTGPLLEKLGVMRRWDVRFAVYADAANSAPVLGEPVVEKVNRLWRLWNYGKRDKLVLLQEEIRKKGVLASILYELKYKPELRLPTLKFDPLRWPTQLEFVLNYNKHYKVTADTSRDVLQLQIVLRFKALFPLLAQYDLISGSTFLQAQDQSDYKKRMAFAAQLAKARSYDKGTFVNDAVYRRKQRSKMASMIRPRDYSVLSSRLLRGLPAPTCLEPLHRLLFKHYFTFSRQNEFFFEWYSAYITRTAQAKRVEYNGFYHISSLHETRESRQTESRYMKRRVLHRRHWDYNYLLDWIHNPTFVKVDGLVKDMPAFRRAFEFFMKQFKAPASRVAVDPRARLGSDPHDLTRFFFFLD